MFFFGIYIISFLDFAFVLFYFCKMNYIKSLIFILSCSVFTISSKAQITGTISSENGEKIPFAIVYWMESWVSTESDVEGKFTIVESDKNDDTLVIDAVGFKKYFLPVQANRKYYEIKMQSTTTLNEVVITHRQNSTYINALDPIKTQTIKIKELQKSACCNLSEAFENNISVDVMNGDALSGAKQLRMMGLDGIYTYNMRENQPQVRGISIPFTFDMIPGTWLENIQLNTGTGSVVHGHESISGNINLEFLKPDKSDLLNVNVFSNTNGRIEANIHAAYIINPKLSTGIYTHGNFNKLQIDKNKDSFLDMPLRNGISLMNRWKYKSSKFTSSSGIIYLQDERNGGQMRDIENRYALRFANSRIEAFSKNAILFPTKPYRGLGFNINLVHSDLDAVITKTSQKNEYNAQQSEINMLLMYQTIIKDNSHVIKAGLSNRIERLHENYDGNVYRFLNRTEEMTPGAFLEYTYIPNSIWTFLIANRVDYYDMKKLYLTPKLFFKYQVNETSTLRFMVGRGFRKSYSVAENISMMMSPKYFQFNPAKLDPEVAWNFGLNFVKDFSWHGNQANIIADLVSTQFEKQNILDINTLEDFYTIHTLSQNETSYSNSAQIEMNSYFGKYIEMKLAYRINYAKTTYQSGTLTSKYMLPRSKTLWNISYTSNFDRWKSSLTLVRTGRSLLPYMHAPNMTSDLRFSPAYISGIAQVSRQFLNWEIYLGVENLFNYTQPDPIVSVHQIDGSTDYDATQIWGPTIGRSLYIGFRYKIQ